MVAGKVRAAEALQAGGENRFAGGAAEELGWPAGAEGTQTGELFDHLLCMKCFHTHCLIKFLQYPS